MNKNTQKFAFNLIEMTAEFPQPELLLHPNIPKPLHGINPRTILGQKWWHKVRHIAYAKNNYHCWACGIYKSQAKYYKWLEAHEIYEIDYARGKIAMKAICALCHSCHNYIHDGRMQMMVMNGIIDFQKYVDIINHGENLINQYLFSLNKKTTRITWKRPLEPTLPFQNVFPQLTIPNLPKPVSENTNWSDWHLVLNGKKYYSRFTDFEEWQAYYQWLNDNKLKDNQQVFLSFKKQDK